VGEGKTMSLLVRQHLIFSGIVQNVGFRYEMSRLANLHGLTGWVHNRTDGTVEAQVQGSPETIRQVVDELKQIDHIQIETIQETNLPVVNGENRFVTRYFD